MRDSRVGAYGAIAIALSLILRVGALAALLDGGFWRAAPSLILAAAVSRAAALTPLALLPPARADGPGAAAGRLDPARFAAAWGSALVIALALGLGVAGLGPRAPRGAGQRSRRSVHGRSGAPADRRTDRRRGGRGATIRRNRRLCGLLIGHAPT